MLDLFGGKSRIMCRNLPGVRVAGFALDNGRPIPGGRGGQRRKTGPLALTLNSLGR